MKKIKTLIIFLAVSLSGFFLYKSATAQSTNLLPNGGFELDFSGWSSTSTTITSDAHSGSKAANMKGDSSVKLQTNPDRVTLKAGKTYKVTLWLKIKPATACSGDCWGGFKPRIDNPIGQITGQYGTEFLNQYNRPVDSWFKESFTLTNSGPTDGSAQIIIGPFSGASWNWDVVVDDVAFFEVTGNTPPTASFTPSTTSVTTIPGDVVFISTADDPDGAIKFYFWDFGDGGKSNAFNPTHTYVGNGTYIAKLTVYDDNNTVTSTQTIITVNDSNYPIVTVVSPAQNQLTTAAALTSISGTSQVGAGKSIARVEWSTDRGLKGTASGTSDWNFAINLAGYGGKNRVLINAIDSSGNIGKTELVIDYRPADRVTILGGAAGVTQNSSAIEYYDKFEATFQLQNSVASNIYIPYITNLTDGMTRLNGTGVTVDGLFTSPTGKTSRQPGFVYQQFQRRLSPQGLIAQNPLVWKIRFAPQEKGNWTYQIQITDASGTTTVSNASVLKFTAIDKTNPENHGFLRVSKSDWRYFEFDDGTPFIGVGPSVYVGDSFQTDKDLAQVGTKSNNLNRTWLSGTNVAGSSWASWTGAIEYDGNYPGTSLTTNQAYADGIFSFTLPQKNGKKCAFYGFQNGDRGIKQNTNYRISVRLKTVGVTGSGGFTFRPNGGGIWSDDCDQFASKPLVVPYIQGTQDWRVVTAIWNSGNSTYLGDSPILLENVTAGRVYIDEISVREELGNDQLGPEVLSRSKFNVQDYFSQEPSWNWDYALEKMAQVGIYQKAVIEEKGDYSYNHISPFGYGIDQDGFMSWDASMKYQEFYWRYLTARWGYSRAVHSWEYANEQAPGSLFEANELGKYLRANDPQKHMASQSPWCCLNGWSTSQTTHPFIDYADTHVYTRNDDRVTSWMGPVDPLTSQNMGLDTAAFVYGHSMNVWQNNQAGSKPIIMGEVGINNASVRAGDNDNDTQGVWWHQLVWAQMNPGGMYFIYWDDKQLKQRNLYGLAKPYREFMEGKSTDIINKRIPLTNGKYSDVQLTTPAGVLGWGQKDIENGGAHFWMYDKNYTWTNLTGGSSMANKSISFDGLPAKNYTVEYWDTWTGAITTETKNHPGGQMTLTIPGSITNKDVAVKIIPETGYPGAGPAVAPKPGDANNDNIVDGFDYVIWLLNYDSTTTAGYTVGDFSADGFVDGFDYVIWLNNYGS